MPGRAVGQQVSPLPSSPPPCGQQHQASQTNCNREHRASWKGQATDSATPRAPLCSSDQHTTCPCTVRPRPPHDSTAQSQHVFILTAQCTFGTAPPRSATRRSLFWARYRAKRCVRIIRPWSDGANLCWPSKINLKTRRVDKLLL